MLPEIRAGKHACYSCPGTYPAKIPPRSQWRIRRKRYSRAITCIGHGEKLGHLPGTKDKGAPDFKPSGKEKTMPQTQRNIKRELKRT